MKIPIPLLTGALLAALAPTLQAQEFRAINPRHRPAASATPAALPAGAVRVNPPLPVARDKVEAAMQKVASAWSNRQLDKVLSKNFYDGQRLNDALQNKVPRDASLRIMGVQSHRLIDQFRNGAQLVSKLSVVVRTQIEFNDAAQGFRRLDGTNEYVITLREVAP